MPTYTVEFPLNLTRTFTVEAEDEEDAIEKAMDEAIGTTISQTITLDDLDADNADVELEDDEILEDEDGD